MRFDRRVIGGFTCVVVLCGAASAHAQPSKWSDLSVTAGRVDFDLSGVGHTTGMALRATRDFTPSVGLELRGLFARPCQQFQSCRDIGPASLFVPEAQLQYRWTAKRLEPFVGGGMGLSALKSSLGTRWDPTVVFSAGTGVRLTDSLALTGEFRLRGHELRFTGTSSEINAGLSWRPRIFGNQ